MKNNRQRADDHRHGAGAAQQPVEFAGHAENAAADDAIDHQAGQRPAADRAGKRHRVSTLARWRGV